MKIEPTWKTVLDFVKSYDHNQRHPNLLIPPFIFRPFVLSLSFHDPQKGTQGIKKETDSDIFKGLYS